MSSFLDGIDTQQVEAAAQAQKGGSDGGKEYAPLTLKRDVEDSYASDTSSTYMSSSSESAKRSPCSWNKFRCSGKNAQSQALKQSSMFMSQAMAHETLPFGKEARLLFSL